MIRKIKFSKAFVVDYSENFSNNEGVGNFTLFIKQLAGIDIDISSKLHQPPTKTVVGDTNETQDTTLPQTQKTKVLNVLNNGKTFEKPGISFIDKLAKQKNEDLSLLDNNELKKVFAKKIEQSKEAYARAVQTKIKTKKKDCIASNGKVTLSGYGEKAKSAKEFTHVSLDTMFDYCKKIGHELPPKTPSCFDNGIEGSFYACHAEKQLSLLTDKPIGITKDMCDNCIEYFSKHAIHTKQVKITTDPTKTRIFFPNGVIREL